MMFAALYQYLIQYRELSIPGIGNFTVIRNAALMDFPARKIDPPSFTFQLQIPAQASPGRFFYWLGNVLGVSDREAVIRFNDFSFDIRHQLMNGATIDWKGVGVLSKGLAGEIRFVQAQPAISPELPVGAEKVIREKPEHMVRVGEDQKTATEMTALLERHEQGRKLWWAIPLAIALLSIIFIGWHFSSHGISVSSTGNAAKLTPVKPGSTYQLVP